MQTFENSRIRVTVSDEIADGFADSAKYHSSISKQTPEQALRGLVLSRGMEIIGNRSESQLLENEAQNKIDQREVMALARSVLLYEYLDEHSNYRSGETYMRMTNGLRMSAGMQNEADMANAFARSALDSMQIDEIYKEAQKHLNNWTHRVEAKLKLAASDNRSIGQKAIEKAIAMILQFRFDDLAYRKAVANAKGWHIEIIGELPNQIGLCRVVQ